METRYMHLFIDNIYLYLTVNLGLDYLFASTKDTFLLSQVIDERGQISPYSLANTVGNIFFKLYYCCHLW